MQEASAPGLARLGRKASRERAVLKPEEGVPIQVVGGLASPCPSQPDDRVTMDTRPRTPTSIRVPIAWKFFALLAPVIPSLLAVSWVGGRGMVEMKERLDAVYDDNLASTHAIGSPSVALEEAEEMSLRLVDRSIAPRWPASTRSCDRRCSPRSPGA
jgi:hypothetical protein